MAFGFTRAETRRISATLSVAAALVSLLALLTLGVRASLRLDLSWDSFAYHLPFAALRGGLSIPYDLNDKMRPAFEGYPVLPELLQGVLWRLSGSMNAAGVVNYLALAGYLTYSHRVLRAPFWLVALISLTAPLVVIHSATSYVDLVGNVLLAAGACSCLRIFLFPEASSRAVLVGGLVGLAGSAWCKYLLCPIAALVFLLFTGVALRRSRALGLSWERMAALCAAAALVAALPYIKNCIVYGNPFWPQRVPFVGGLFAYTSDAIGHGYREQPAQLAQLAQFELFIHSLFEIDHPTRYLWRPRWTIDQGNAGIAFRMGGFWAVAAGVYWVTLVALLVACQRRRGMVAGAGILLLLGFVACLPQSHQLRYFMFIPLSGAAAIAMLFPKLEQLAPRAALALLTVSMGLFVHMVFENSTHYRIERVDQAKAAFAWGADLWWPKLVPGRTYCAVELAPMALLLAGPTLSEYSIVDRSRAARCPAGSVHLDK